MHNNSAPWYSRVFKMRRSDGIMIMGGIMLASASSYFPYYVYNHADEFGPPRMVFTGGLQAEIEAQARDELIELVTNGSRAVREGINNSNAPIDSIVTASVDSSASTQGGGVEVIFAASGHALIQDGEDIVPVSRGSRLPDGSTVRSVRQRNGKWQIVTSNDAILRVKN